jgi:hypothetical protein
MSFPFFSRRRVANALIGPLTNSTPAGAAAGSGPADVYTHTTADADRSAALALEEAIFGDLFQVVPRFGTWNKNTAPN